ncbi:hypothetical protein CERZMDRAFT_100418 [Cercospora zeae-maydis SCOH1-5]|uniref:Uncharacterized protein n=1 Tax=Cercospora zeae-maydis SCOH1-5 TaxID=717836 RepID=A0A6A6F750_9PEZI|nr:hypothetical protein CERZMDRAFT_100418 [Cercospora zeae-maydis SCOH1-5]
MADTDSEGSLYGSRWTNRLRPSPPEPRMLDNNISTLTLFPRWDGRPPPLQSDIDRIYRSVPLRLPVDFLNVTELNTEDDDPAKAFLAKFHRLAPELQRMIYKLVFEVPQRTRVLLDGHFRLPSVLQVNAETRRKLLSRYMRGNHFLLMDQELLWRCLYQLIGGFRRFDIKVRHVRGGVLIDIRRKSHWMSVAASAAPRPTGINPPTDDTVPKTREGTQTASENPAFGPHL